jgi:hypothetical protein
MGMAGGCPVGNLLACLALLPAGLGAQTTAQPILSQGTPAGLQEAISVSTYADSASATVVLWGTQCL